MKTCIDKYSILLSNILKEASTIYQRQEGDTLQQGFGLVGVRNGKGDRLGDVIILVRKIESLLTLHGHHDSSLE